MKTKIRGLARAAYATLAVALTTTIAFPGLAQGYSGGQVTSRSIQMSSSVPSATGLTYKVSFTPATNAQEVIIDFCSNSPIPGDSCTATGGTNVPNTASVSGTGVSAVSDGSTSHTIKLTGQTLTASSAYSIQISGVANPSATASFYARIFTYTTGGAASYTPVASGTPTEGSPVDYGGIALSTTNTISITAKVMEQLTFCVSGGSITDCSSTTSPALSLGHGSPTPVLTNTQVDSARAYTQLSTNAQTGAIVRMKASNSCNSGGLSASGGSTCDIPGVGASEATIAAGTAGIGMCVLAGSNTTPDDPYANTHAGSTPCSTTWANTIYYGMDGNSSTGTTSTYGSQVFHTAGPVSQENNSCIFAATASLTTPAGIYTGNESLIATGTF